MDRIINFLYFTYTIEPAELSEADLKSITGSEAQENDSFSVRTGTGEVNEGGGQEDEEEEVVLTHRELRMLKRAKNANEPIYKDLILPGMPGHGT